MRVESSIKYIKENKMSNKLSKEEAFIEKNASKFIELNKKDRNELDSILDKINKKKRLL